MSGPYHDQACPLCNTAAKYKLVDYDVCKRFICEFCGVYIVSKEAETRIIAPGNGEVRTQLKQLIAEKRPGLVLCVRTEPNPIGAVRLSHAWVKEDVMS